ncbi:MAG: AAA family ATPase [Ruminococcus callidus]
MVFITAMQGEKKKNDGLCLVCAKELHVPQIDEYMKQMGITDEELEQISNQMMDMMDGDSFEMGGSGVMPQFLQNMIKDTGKALESLQNGGVPAKGDEDVPQADYTEVPVLPAGNAVPSGKRNCGSWELLHEPDPPCRRKLDAIGRDKEIARVIQILSRRTKNNPCLIGEPGVGKTAIAEGIALRIHSGNVPMHLKDKQVYLLDLTSLVAGTQFRGQFESRVKGLLAEVKQEGNIILFIDEVHNLVGAGNSEGAMNAANILKPALSRGEVQVIGATTFEEYRKYIEKDSALERRFQPVTVNEPTVDETIEVLNGIAKYYESYHRVHISPEMIRLCAVLAERYIADRFLPDKANRPAGRKLCMHQSALSGNQERMIR